MNSAYLYTSKMLSYDTSFTTDHTDSPATNHKPYSAFIPPLQMVLVVPPTEGWPGWVNLIVWLDQHKFPTLGVERWRRRHTDAQDQHQDVH